MEVAITANKIKVKILKILRAIGTPVLLTIFGSITLILIIITIVLERDDANRSIENSAVKYLRSITYQQKEIIKSSDQLLMILAKNREIVNYNSPECDDYAKEIIAKNNTYLNIGVNNLKGEVVCAAIEPTIKVNISDRGYFIKAIESGEYEVGDYQIGRIVNKPTIPLARPVFDDSNEMTGILVAMLNLDWLSNLTEYESPQNEINISVYDDNNKIVFRYPNNKEWMGKDMPEKTLFDQTLMYHSGTVKMKGSDNKERIYAYSPLLEQDQTLFVAVGIVTGNYKSAVDRSFVNRPAWTLTLSIVSILFIVLNIIFLAMRKCLKIEK